jgi:hypothetical protein
MRIRIRWTGGGELKQIDTKRFFQEEEMVNLKQEKITISKKKDLGFRISKVADELRTRTEKLGKCKTRLVNCAEDGESFELTYEFITDSAKV